MILTPEQLQEIQQLIRDQHNAFVVNTIGPHAVPADVLERLKKLKLYNPQVEAIREAYLYGQLVGSAESARIAKMSYPEFQEYLRKSPPKLTEAEQSAVRFASQRAGEHITALGSRASTRTSTALISADTRVRAIRDQVAQNTARRKTVGELRSTLGWLTGDWQRDWDRVAITETHDAMQHGIADIYGGKYGEDAYVAKRPMPSACEHCKRVFLGPDGHPRIFPLETLRENGTNVGRKAKEWQATIGPVHPHCLPGDAEITTYNGVKQIKDICPGDLVQTHKEHWQPVTHVWESYFEGTWVTVELSDGRVIKATGEHPFLTSSGWVLAEDLQDSDCLIGSSAPSDLLLGVDVDAQPRPAMPQENPLFASVIEGFSRSGVPITAVYLNGEFYLREGEINVDSLQGVVRDRGETSIDQPVVNPAFVGRFNLTEFGLCSGDTLFKRVGSASDSIMSILCERFPLFRSHFLHSNGVSFPHTTLGVSGFCDAIDNGAPGATEMMRYLLNSHQLVEVHIDNFGNVEFNPSRMIPTKFNFTHNKTPFKHCSIASVTLSKTTRVVYNLTVKDDHSFVTNGVVTHNCSCQLVRIPKGWGFDEEGNMVPDGEFGVRYEDGEEIERAIQWEADLKKSHTLQGTLDFQGLSIAVENKPGSVREWKASDGSRGQTRMQVAYGYVRGTEGLDSDEIDVFVGPYPEADQVFVIEQQDPLTGIFDEQKCMIGFLNQEQAEREYQLHYDRRDFRLTSTPMDLEHFKRWVSLSREKKEEKPKPIYTLRKAGRVDASIGAMASPAGKRNVVDGIGLSDYGEVIKDREKEKKKRKPLHEVGYYPEKADLLDDEEDAEMRQAVRESMAREKEAYIFQEPFTRDPQTIEPPPRDKTARDGADRRREQMIDWDRRNKLPVNRTPVKRKKK